MDFNDFNFYNQSHHVIWHMCVYVCVGARSGLVHPALGIHFDQPRMSQNANERRKWRNCQKVVVTLLATCFIDQIDGGKAKYGHQNDVGYTVYRSYRALNEHFEYIWNNGHIYHIFHAIIQCNISAGHLQHNLAMHVGPYSTPFYACGPVSSIKTFKNWC